MMTDFEGKEIKFAANGVKVSRWFNEKFYTYWRHGGVTTIDPALLSTTLRKQMFEHGIEARFGDKAAIKVEEIPNVEERAKEGQRRMEELRDHYYNGGSWNMERKGGGSGPGKEDLIEIVDRVAPGKGQIVVGALMSKHAEDLAKVRTEIMSKGKFALVWVDMQAERARARAATLDVGNIDDFVAGLVA